MFSLVYSLLPEASKTFVEYVVLDVVPKIQMYSSNFAKTDIVFDVYWTSSLRAETSPKRGKGIDDER